MTLRRLLLGVLIGLAGCAKPLPPVPSATPSPVAVNRWTLLLYCACDNDLEEATLHNLREIAKIGSSSEIVTVALVDRAETGHRQEGYSNEPLLNLPHWSGAKLLKIEPGQFTELADWGSVNMADGAVFSRFLRDSLARFPARHYALVILDHGDAWAGVCIDDTAKEPDDMLRPAELADALREAGFSDKKKLDLVVFDACLMANLELLSMLREQVRLVLASEEIVPQAGLNYSGSLDDLKRGTWKNEDEALRLAKDLVVRNRPSLKNETTHLVLLRLNRLETLEKLVAELARGLLAKLKQSPRDTWLKLARCRAASQDFGRSEVPLVPNAEVRDVADLCRHLAGAFPDQAPLCSRIEACVKDLRITQAKSETLPHAEGLTIFFPPQTESAQELASTDYFTLVPPQLREWSEMVKAYTQIERNDSSRPALEKVQVSADVWEPGEVVQLQSRLNRPQELETCQFLISQKDLILGCLPSFPEENSTLVHDEFDGTSVVLSDTFGHLFCPLARLDESGRRGQDVVFVSAPAQFRRDGKSWVDINLVFRFDLAEEAFKGKLARVTRSSKRNPVTLQKGDVLRLLYQSLKDGKAHPGESMKLIRPALLCVKPWPLPAGDYLMGYRIQDYTGRTALQTTPIRVER